MSILSIEESVIRINEDFHEVLSEVVHATVDIVGKEYFVLALCEQEEEKLELAA